MDDKEKVLSTGGRTIRGVALDLDGLLYDTEPLYWRVGTTLLQRRGLEFTEQLQMQMMGRPGLQAISVMVQFHDLPDTPDALLAESDEIYAGMLATELHAMPGLDTLVRQLHQARLPFGVATSSRRRFAEHILQRDRLIDRLVFLLTGEDVTHGKPHPEMYQLAAQRLGIPASEMLVLEDSANGCAAAVAAGAITVAVPGAHSQAHNFDGAALQAVALDDPRLLRWIQHGQTD